jgi:hypothetical protein
MTSADNCAENPAGDGPAITSNKMMLTLNRSLKPSVKPSVRGYVLVGASSERVVQESLAFIGKMTYFKPENRR